jgi:NADP-dependent 3-hydroxy acid dehydrogenase YdfG
MTTAGVADKVVVITGASSGFGKGTALALAVQGATVVLAARRGHLLRRGGGCLPAGRRPGASAVPTT